ncbi:MAG: LysM peptidoglycan-binding domain-containing protein, partial [Oscillospiraceae bacterium]|nr:LysM peptidoglycan-binding domain-containing protein [Oscillospiraceae bacterium]
MSCPERITYTVRRGDTLARLARRYRTSVELMLSENPHLNPDMLTPGEILTICPGYTALPARREAPRVETREDGGVWFEPMPRHEPVHAEIREQPAVVWVEPAPRPEPIAAEVCEQPGSVWFEPMPRPEPVVTEGCEEPKEAPREAPPRPEHPIIVE